MLWSLHCFVLFSFVFYMNYHLYFIWIVIHCSYTEAIMFLIFGLLLLKWILCISCILCVLKLCVYTGQHGRTASGWMFLPCINILEIKKKKKNSPHKGQWRGALMFSLICVWINGWVKQLSGGWFETLLCPLWRHHNAVPSDACPATAWSCCKTLILISGH